MGSSTAKGTLKYARHSEYWNKFETKMSVSRRKRSTRMLQQYAKQSQSLLLYCNIVQIARLVFHRPWSHTPFQDDGDEPMMDLARSLQVLGVHALADMQTWCVHTQKWYEHVAASICADEEELTVAQRHPSRKRNRNRNTNRNRNKNRNRQLSVIVNIETDAQTE